LTFSSCAQKGKTDEANLRPVVVKELREEGQWGTLKEGSRRAK